MHGMGHSFDRFYWKDWAAPLRIKLAEKGLELGEEQFGGVYYYDLVPGPGKTGVNEERVQIQLLGLRERAIGELGILRAPFAKGIEAVKKLADHIIDNFGDIFTYLYWENTRIAVNDRLYEAIDASSGPVHLIGYSLGSLVCYCALKENKEMAQRVSQLIMVGSPLYWFKAAVAECVDLESRPAVGRFSNVAGILDIAWPQAVPGVIGGLDQNIEFTINLFDPIKGHSEYFKKEEGLRIIATELLKCWNG
ncbi:MAG: alpha/beta hydrolase [Peptococcaceae bacterium MAG4]|nr:alpha/beta hydrolase [Peptococcaceae bacterium MAG4]NLW38601.1 hypothetical protein [Peptococcaceae bacterium]